MRRFTFLILFTCLCTVSFAQKSFEVQITGNGQSLIFLPGFTCPGEVWNQTIENLNTSYQTYQFTYAGFGEVPEIELPWYGTLSADISAFIAEQDLQNVVVIGHSMGGMLALDIAANNPDRVSKMILVDALPCIREIMMPHLSAEQITFDNPYNQQMIAATDSALRVTAGYMAMGMSNSPDKHADLVNYIMQSDRKTYVYGYTELLKLDLRAKLSAIPTETLILGADFPSKEAVLPNFKKQFVNLKNKDIKIATNSKHFIMFDQPEWFYNEVNNFLQ